MPNFAINNNGELEFAPDATCAMTSYKCHACGKAVEWKQKKGLSFFVHVSSHNSCHLPDESFEDKNVDLEYLDTNISDWMKSWQQTNIDADEVEFVESMTKKDCGKVCVFNSTEYMLWSYEKYAANVFFCEDFSDVSTTYEMYFHCSDGNVYKTMCPDSVSLEVEGEIKSVRLLTSQNVPDVFKDTPTLKHVKEAMVCEEPIRVMSISGQREFDKIHRNFFFQISRTIIHYDYCASWIWKVNSFEKGSQRMEREDYSIHRIQQSQQRLYARRIWKKFKRRLSYS